MVLERLDDDYSILPHFGVIFSLGDRYSRKRVLFAVDRSALKDRARFDGKSDAEWPDMWRKHRQQIEALGVANYQDGRPPVEGRILITSANLTGL